MAFLPFFRTISVKIALRIERGPEPPGRHRLSLSPHAHYVHPDFPISLRFSRSRRRLALRGSSACRRASADSPAASTGTPARCSATPPTINVLVPRHPSSMIDPQLAAGRLKLRTARQRPDSEPDRESQRQRAPSPARVQSPRVVCSPGPARPDPPTPAPRRVDR